MSYSSVPHLSNSPSRLEVLEPADATFIEIATRFRGSWKQKNSPSTPSIKAIYRILLAGPHSFRHQQYRSLLSANGNDEWVFYVAPKLCVLGDGPGIQQPCSSPDCPLCTILRESFNAESCEYGGNYLMFGNKLSAFTRSSAADNYLHNECTQFRLILVCKASLGKTLVTPLDQYYSQDLPPGYHSMKILEGVEFSEERVVLNSVNALQPAFLVQYLVESPSQGTSIHIQDNNTVSNLESLDRSHHSSSLSGPIGVVQEKITSNRAPSALPHIDVHSTDSRSRSETQPTIPPNQTSSLPTRMLSMDQMTYSPVNESGGSACTHGVTSASTPTLLESNGTQSIRSLPSSLPARRLTRDLRFAPKERCSIHSESSYSENEHHLDSECTDNCVGISRLVNRMRVNARSRHPDYSVDTKAQYVRWILSLQGTVPPPPGMKDAQYSIDVLQEILDDAYLWATSQIIPQEMGLFNEFHSHLADTLLRISLESRKLPASLLIRSLNNEQSAFVGSGGFADVYKATYKGQPVALKSLRFWVMMCNSKREERKKAFYHEALTWKNLSHPHVLPLFGISEGPDYQNFRMVTPWMENGNIRALIDDLQQKGITTEELTLRIHRWLKEISQGLAYLHARKIIHADLRGPNILIDSDFGVRVADFGLAVFEEARSARGSMRGGATAWLAPELLDDDEVIDPRPTPSSDIYSFGCVIVELFTNQDPFYPRTTDSRIMLYVLKGGRPNRPTLGTPMSQDLWDLAQLCWEKDPSGRPTAEDVVQDMERICSAFGTVHAG